MNRLCPFASCLRVVVLAIATAAFLTTPSVAKPARHEVPTVDVVDAVDACHWNRPGADPFMGNVVEAVDAYADIPSAVRERLKARMATRNYDDLVSIRRDSISGRDSYGSSISDMHFGARRLCRQVDRAGWPAEAEERGLVYCEGGQCILVPTVCRNVSRITRSAVADESVEGAVEQVAATSFPAPLAPAVPLADAADAERFGEARALGASDGSSLVQLADAGADAVTPASSFQGGLMSAPAGVPYGGSAAPFTMSPLSPIPEPAPWAVLLAGAAAMLARSRHLKRGPS